MLGCPRKIISVVYVHVEHKTKSPHKRVSFLFWKPASTRRDLRFSSPTPRLRCWLAWRAVTPFRCGKMQAVQALRVFNKLSAPSSLFLAGCFFHTSFAKEKTHTIVRVFSFGNRRRHTLPGTCPRHTSRSSSLRRKMCGALLAHRAQYSFCVGKIFPLPCSAF